MSPTSETNPSASADAWDATCEEIFEPLPQEFKAMWAVPAPGSNFARRVVDSSSKASSPLGRTARPHWYRMALALTLGGVSAAAAFFRPNPPALSPDSGEPTRAPSKAITLPFVPPGHPAFAEPALAQPRAVPRMKEKTLPPASPRLHYPLCGCSSGAVVCSCVEAQESHP
jgi:hypothetical protein